MILAESLPPISFKKIGFQECPSNNPSPTRYDPYGLHKEIYFRKKKTSGILFPRIPCAKMRPKTAVPVVNQRTIIKGTEVPGPGKYISAYQITEFGRKSRGYTMIGKRKRSKKFGPHCCSYSPNYRTIATRNPSHKIGEKYVPRRRPKTPGPGAYRTKNGILSTEELQHKGFTFSKKPRFRKRGLFVPKSHVPGPGEYHVDEGLKYLNFWRKRFGLSQMKNSKALKRRRKQRKKNGKTVKGVMKVRKARNRRRKKRKQKKNRVDIFTLPN